VVLLSFKQGEEESLGITWHRFASLVETCPALGLPDPVLLQYFWVGLLEDSAMRLDALSGGAFVFQESE
jgi:hypothetical protein